MSIRARRGLPAALRIWRPRVPLVVPREPLRPRRSARNGRSIKSGGSSAVSAASTCSLGKF
jgi:hypothetical protein